MGGGPVDTSISRNEIRHPYGLFKKFKMTQEQEYRESPVHFWFELSHAQYLTIPRSIMEAMPHEWQERMAKCLNELDETFEWRPKSGRYWVRLKDDNGKYSTDPLMQYRHPDIKYIEAIKTKVTNEKYNVNQ